MCARAYQGKISAATPVNFGQRIANFHTLHYLDSRFSHQYSFFLYKIAANHYSFNCQLKYIMRSLTNTILKLTRSWNAQAITHTQEFMSNFFCSPYQGIFFPVVSYFYWFTSKLFISLFWSLQAYIIDRRLLKWNQISVCDIFNFWATGPTKMPNLLRP